MIAGPDPRVTGRLLPCGAKGAPLPLCIHGGGCSGRYFDLPGFSVVQAAHARGFDILLVDRPGHGDSAPPRTDKPILETAALLPTFVETVLAGRGGAGLAVIGHSIGGAVALHLAADGRLPIRTVAVSGIGRVPSGAAVARLHAAANGAEPPSDLFFGPEGSYEWRGPAALRRALEPWRADEVHEVMNDWPARFDEVAAGIEIPVSFALAEHDGIWRVDMEEMAAIATSFGRAARVDATVLPDGGHVYEIHKRGHELTIAQVDFMLSAEAAWPRARRGPASLAH